MSSAVLVVLSALWALPVAGCRAAPPVARAASVSDTAASPVPATTRQLVVVTTAGWGATTGTLRRFERAGDGWAPVGEAVAVNVGRGGLGWGRGLHGAADTLAGDPQKREGDGRAPAGAFRLTGAFGADRRLATGLPYHPVRPSSVCVDDARSIRYNRVLDPAAADVVADWVSREDLARAGTVYRVAAIVAHNGPTADPSWAPGTQAVGADDTVPGAGSCIFLHVERAPGAPTVGCTSMPEAALRTALAWLDRDDDPVLVQLPEAAYRRLQAAWGLP